MRANKHPNGKDKQEAGAGDVGLNEDSMLLLEKWDGINFN